METAGAGAERPAETEETSWRHRAEEAASCSEDRDKLSEEDREDTKLSLITWNVDGLDGEEQPERARGLCSELTRFSPDVVFLQELVQPYVRFLHKRLSDVYTYIEGVSESIRSSCRERWRVRLSYQDKPTEGSST
ncbi:hypothetical protein INR49_022026 [Caranx melampygus]|nr:hypothetical protein INR49_022026 [Caranx melampygus]